MRIALIQLPADEVEACAGSGIPAERIGQLLDLAAAHHADLAVFPEGYPFIMSSAEGAPVRLEQAKADLEALPAHPVACILGGYVMERDTPRNASFLIHQGHLHEPYFKRVRWQDEQFEPGTALLRWRWVNHQVIPLICADVCVPWNAPDGRTAQMLGEAIALGAGPACPIIVSTFGADLRTPYWTAPLRAWARACNAPVLVAAIAGASCRTFDEGDGERAYGGGGSGMYWVEGGRDYVWPKAADSVDPAMYVLDTDHPQSLRVPLDALAHA